MLERCMSRLERVVDSNHGRVIDDSGWTMAALFHDALSATEAARQMCLRVAQLPPVASHRISVSAGIALTPDQALALVETAPPGAVLTSTDIEAALAPAATADSDDSNEEPKEKYPAAFDRTIVGGSLILRFEGRVIVLDEMHSHITLGRSPECGIRINVPMASRVHATIMKNGNCFALIDASTNGTYVTDASGNETIVQKRVHFLENTGRLSLGQSTSEAGKLCVSFESIF